MQWLPDSLSWPVAAGLIVFSFFMSAMTAVLGVGGGTGMLAVMAGIFPPVTLIPIHGVVQLGSNGGRALVMLKHVHRKIFGYFFAGGLIGTAAAANLLYSLFGFWEIGCINVHQISSITIVYHILISMPNVCQYLC